MLNLKLLQWIANHDQLPQVFQFALSPGKVVDISPDFEIIILQRKVGELWEVVRKSRQYLTRTYFIVRQGDRLNLPL